MSIMSELTSQTALNEASSPLDWLMRVRSSQLLRAELFGSAFGYEGSETIETFFFKLHKFRRAGEYLSCRSV